MNVSLKYTVINYLVLVANFFREVVLMLLLSSEQIGVWRFFITVFGYFKYFSLGMPSLIVYRGRKKNLQLMYLKHAVPIVLMANSILSIGLFFYLYFYEKSMNEVLWIYFPLVVIVALFNLFSSYFMGIVDILKVSVSSFLMAYLFLFLSFFLSPVTARDAIFYLLISYLLSVFYLAYFFYSKHGTKSLFEFVLVGRLFRLLKLTRYAIKSSFSSFLFYSFTSADVFFIKGSYGVSFLGLFSPVLIFYNLMLNAISVFNVLLMAKFKSFLEFSLFNSIKIVLYIFSFSLVLVLLFCFIYYQITDLYFPKYLSSYKEVFEYLLCMPFLVINGYVLTLLIANNGVGKYSIVIISFLLIKVFLYNSLYTDLVFWLAVTNALCILVVLFVFFMEVLNEIDRRYAREK